MSFIKPPDTSDDHLAGPSTQRGVEIYYADVLSVNEDKRTCNIRIKGHNGYPMKDVPYASSMLSPDGSGIDFVPAIGSSCIVAKRLSNMSSEFNNSPFILGFRPSLSETSASWKGDRQDLASSDVVISSLDRNRVELLSNGTTKVMAHEACSLEFYPDTSKIHAFCSNLLLQAGGGRVEWLVDSDDEIGSAQFKATIKTSANPEINGNELYTFEAGDSDIPKVISKVIDPSTSRGVILWEGTAEGDLTLDITKTLKVRSGESSYLEALGGLTVSSPIINISTSNSSITISPEEVSLSAPKVNITADSFRVSSRSGEQVFVHGEAEDEEDTLNKQLVTEDILNWVFNHVHLGNGTPALGRPSSTSEIASEEISPEIVAEEIANSQADALNTNVGELADLESISQGIVAASNPHTQLLIEGVIDPLLTLLKDRYQREQDSAVSSATGQPNIPIAGVINSYSQVLTQNTKVR